jgi:hypothetical protein
MIEHLRIDRVAGFLREVHRVLRPGGLFRVTCPDLRLFVAKYVSGDRSFFERIVTRSKDKLASTNDQRYWLVRGPGSAFMSYAYFHHHRWFYDFDTLEVCLREVGFSDVVQQAFGRSLVAEATLDNPDREWETLYVDAVK